MSIAHPHRLISSYCRLGLFLSAAALLTVAIWDGNSFAQGYAFPSSKAASVPFQPHPLLWESDFDAAMARAKKEDRPLFIHFCLPNQSMEMQVFSQPSIALRLQTEYVLLKVNVSENAILPQKFAVSAVPTNIILTSQGELSHRQMGEITAERFSEYLSFLQKLLQSASVPASAARTNAAPTGAVVSPSVESSLPIAETVSSPFAVTPPAAVPPVSVPEVSSVSSASAALPGTVPQRSALPVGGTPAPVVNNPFGEQHIAGNTHSVEKTVSNPLRTHDPSAAFNAQTFQVLAENPAIPPTGRVKPTSVTAETKGSESIGSKKTVEVPLALEGFCPVTLCSEERWVTGNPAYCTMYQGHIFRFASLDALSKFAQKPASFVPVAMGEDVVYMTDRNKKVQGQRQFGAWFQGRIFLFANLETLNTFESRPEYYAEIALKYETARSVQPTMVVY